jgi:hypothetical protein
VILVDTSAWIEFLRGTGSATCVRVDEALGGEVAICEAIRMEVLAGGRDGPHMEGLRRLLARAVMISIEPGDFDHAATLYRECRRRGETVRKLIDCLIAAVAIRAGVPVLHNDSDYETLARHTALKLHT